MSRDIDIEKLEDKFLDIKEVKEIFERNLGDKEMESMVAMNLSQKTSVYDKELGKSDEMEYILEKLLESESMEARWAVAKNPHTPTKCLEILAKDGINLVRALVATNPNTPASLLDKFFSDEKIVRDGLSGNPNTSLKLLNLLSDDSDKMVRLRVAENPSVSKEILEKLLDDKEKDIQIAAKSKLGKM